MPRRHRGGTSGGGTSGGTGGGTGGAGRRALPAPLRLRMATAAMTSPKARLAYAKSERDQLNGRLAALDAIRRGTTWGGAVRCAGDAEPADERWNLGLPPAASTPA